MKCPYCGLQMYEDTLLKKVIYSCDFCEVSMDINSLKREYIRVKMSALLMGTDEQHPLNVNITIGEDDDDNVGLSSLLLPTIDKVFQQPSEGIIWFHIEGEVDKNLSPVWKEFDTMKTKDLTKILIELEICG